MQNEQHLIIFTRFPIPGEAKTRLIPALGAEGAAELQRQMTEHTVAQARKTGAQIEIRYAGGTEAQLRDWLGGDLQYAEQGGGNLGERMARAFQEHFETGAERVVIVGCDCPSNHWKNIQKSFQWLEHNDCVIGPASDGGYYLIGFCRAGSVTPPPRSGTSATVPVEMFENIDWGTERVLAQTLAVASCKPVLLPELDDVDLPADISPKISVIIPALNEEGQLFQTLEKVHEGFDVECIIADGGSTDGTKELSDKFSHFMKCEKGRAAQMNAGAAAAGGELLLFLHADTGLPDNWDFIIRAALRDPAVSLGAFSFGVKERLPGIGLVEWGANIRSRIFGRPYGDQGLFLRRDIFEAIGGFPEQPILEDVELVRRARRMGRVVTVSAAVQTSGRRWCRHGVFRTTLVNQLVLLGAALGVSTQKLRRLYD